MEWPSPSPPNLLTLLLLNTKGASLIVGNCSHNQVLQPRQVFQKRPAYPMKEPKVYKKHSKPFHHLSNLLSINSNEELNELFLSNQMHFPSQNYPFQSSNTVSPQKYSHSPFPGKNNNDN